MEWLKREPVRSRLENLLALAAAGRVNLVMSTISLGEVFYTWLRVNGERAAEDALARIRMLPIHFLHPSAEDVFRAAALKGRFPISYADAFPAVLAAESGSVVVTGDREFLSLQEAGVVAVEWWGA